MKSQTLLSQNELWVMPSLACALPACFQRLDFPTSWDAAITQHSRGLAYMLRASHHLRWTSRGERKKKLISWIPLSVKDWPWAVRSLWSRGVSISVWCCICLSYTIHHLWGCAQTSRLSCSFLLPHLSKRGQMSPLRPFLAFVAWSSVSSEHRSLGHSLHWSTRDSLGYLTADELPPDDWECITTLKSYRKFVVALLKGSVDIRVTKHS